MDLQISVFLLFSLFTAGHSFSCYECMAASCVNQNVKTCPSGSSKCMSSTTVIQVGDIRDKWKVKACAADCVSGSMNIGIVKTSSVCCDTDRCNIQDAPDPSNVLNGKKCYSCDEKSCSNILSCSGSEDRCLKATGTIGGQSTVKGCVSKSICDAETSLLRGVERISCCEGNLCNGAQSVTQSFLFLCCSLLSFILLH
ncbi:phospholipase A2 inhibitor NAI-like isoform X1 [Onychostoma macrolepis]|uniref:phospholipase A2 inhibitor NAI-like isoform X1 n=2 Tax=Onychostoma macrolepis TaxID=369639 RepID=UPI00272A0F60|nr:phospholipase A2 inhibitor NAI-like isoform X1 [Onychostoma macrolepis]XP_058613292.1 phospholipase A2 inhibitor NAI-like isoform X1 [Onychostoma macrolepis]XP_058613293.1 phospholipase A2 inhibitor NAI-like isoform X1 [Onychostoma macrolepis]XP_058613294.1 phospholipase A2 inhibitor NAI-like isoform X1 [Onychostoma macrolepis]